MAYPVPRFGTPQTPHHVEQTLDDSPRESMIRPSDTMRQYKRYLMGAAAIVLLVLWMKFLNSSPNQTDRVPFTHDSTEK